MKDTAILFLAKVIEKGVMFIFYILIARAFGKELVGELSYYYSIVVILFVLLDLGGDFYQIREFSKSETLSKFNTIFIIKTTIFIFMLMPIIYLGNIYITVLFSSYFINSLISIFRSSLYCNNQYINESKYAILEKLLFIMIVISNIITIKSILILYFAFLISKLIVILLLVNKFYKIKFFNIQKTFNIQFAKSYVKGSWSYILHALLVVVFVQVDIIMLKSMNISYSDIGLYSTALKIYALSIVFADILFKQYYPTVSKLIENRDFNQLEPYIKKVQSTNLFFSIYSALFIIIFSKEIIGLAFGEAFLESAHMLMLLAIIVIFRFSMYTYTAILSASNLNYIKLYTSITCVIFNIVLNYILIPKYGVYGAIYATIATEILLTTLYKISSFKIIFTNYFTFQELFIIAIAFMSILIFSLVSIDLKTKIIIGFLLILSLIINHKKIKNKLNFKEQLC